MSDLEHLVCSACGQACCWQGEMFCEDYRSASVVPRWRWERTEAHRRLAVLVPGMSTDGTLLQVVGLVERHMEDDL